LNGGEAPTSRASGSEVRWKCPACGYDRFAVAGGEDQHRRCQNPDCGALFSLVPAHWVRRGHPAISTEGADEEEAKFYDGIQWFPPDGYK